MDYILTWSDGIGRVSAGNYLYDVLEKPALGFDFDAIYYETPTNMHIKILNGAQTNLSNSEILKCREYCDSFHLSDDFKVMTIDPEFKIYKGIMTRRECKEQGLEEISESLGLTPPDFPLSKLVNNTWERVVACITEEGRLVLLPAEDNPKFNFFFTEEEWDNFDKPSFTSDLFNFKTNKWEDARDFSGSISRAEAIVRNIASREYDQFKITHTLVDPVLYLYQYIEANAYKNDISTATPFIDAVVSCLDDETKDSFVKRILGKYDSSYLTTLGSIHGKMQKTLDAISNCTDLKSLDSIMIPFSEEHSIQWKIPYTINL